MHQIEWTEYSREEYDKLDGSQKVFVDKALNRIKLRGMSVGQPLHGSFAVCNKLKYKKWAYESFLEKYKVKLKSSKLLLSVREIMRPFIRSLKIG